MTKQIKWIALMGKGDFSHEPIVFNGGINTTYEDGQSQYEVGNFISDQDFGGGIIRATIKFKERHPQSAAGLILNYHPQSGGFIEAQLGGPSLCALKTWSGFKWIPHATIGSSEQLEAGKLYEFDVRVIGTHVRISLNGVRVLETNLPFPFPLFGQAGIWAMGPNEIEFYRFMVEAKKQKIFVIMQFTAPFNELYNDVIQPIGKESGFDVIRADERYKPGLIIADIERQIIEANAIIADITPNNPNVYWEVGYAFAVRKPTVLIAEHETKPPFDVYPFRTLFYENTIAGKKKIEEGLRKHLEAIKAEWRREF